MIDTPRAEKQVKIKQLNERGGGEKLKDVPGRENSICKTLSQNRNGVFREPRSDLIRESTEFHRDEVRKPKLEAVK